MALGSEAAASQPVMEVDDVFAQGPSWTGKRNMTAAQNDPLSKKGKSKGKGAGKGKDTDRLEQMAVATAKLVMVVAKDVQDLQATVYETWELNAEKPLAVAATTAGQRYDADAKELKERHAVDSNVDTAALGPPHLVVAASVIKDLATLVGPEEKTVLEEFWKTVVCKEDSATLGECITHFQTKKNKQPHQKQEKVRLIFSFDLHVKNMSIVKGIMVREIQKEGGQRKVGSAPRGPLQRELNRLVYPQGQTS